MAHDEWFEPISAAADGELDGPEAVRLDEHLETCAPCRDLLRSFERDRRLARLQPSGTTGDLAGAVLLARRQEGSARRSGSRSAHAKLVRRGGVALGLVAAAMIAVVTMSHTPPQPVPPAPALARHEVMIDALDHSFDRADVEVAAGTTVEWRNAGATKHKLVRRLGPATITEDLLPGRTETATFSAPGTYHFSCEIHPDMTGTVTVDA